MKTRVEWDEGGKADGFESFGSASNGFEVLGRKVHLGQSSGSSGLLSNKPLVV